MAWGEWRRQQRGTHCVVAPAESWLSSIWRFSDKEVRVCVWLLTGMPVCALHLPRELCVYYCTYVQRCGKLTVSCEHIVRVCAWTGFTEARNRDLVLIAFTMMTLLAPRPPSISPYFRRLPGRGEQQKRQGEQTSQGAAVEAMSGRTGRRWGRREEEGTH